MRRDLGSDAVIIITKKTLPLEKVEVVINPRPNGARIPLKEDIKKCVTQENSKGGWNYVMCSAQGGRGGAFPHKAGKHGGKKLANRLADGDNLQVMSQIANDNSDKKIFMITIDCNDLTKAELDAVESILIQYVNSRNPDCFNTQKTSVGYRYDPNVSVQIPGVTRGPFKCPQNIGTAAQKKLGQDLMYILGIK